MSLRRVPVPKLAPKSRASQAYRSLWNDVRARL